MNEGLVFPSKIDGWLLWIVRLTFLTSLVPCALGLMRQPEKRGALVFAVLIVAAAVAFTEWTFHSTKYTIAGSTIHVQSGFFRWQIPIPEIESITRTRNPLSSPAASLDRIDIRYAGGHSLMISPADRDRFIEVVKAMNPAIRA